MTSSGSKSTACNESKVVNVGGPDKSQRERVLENKPKNREFQKVYQEVRCVIVPVKRSNNRRGKDAG
jgi:hypothetical protein